MREPGVREGLILQAALNFLPSGRTRLHIHGSALEQRFYFKSKQMIKWQEMKSSFQIEGGEWVDLIFKETLAHTKNAKNLYLTELQPMQLPV